MTARRQTLRELSDAGRDEVRALADRLAAESGAPPLNDESLARLSSGSVVHLLLRDGDGAGLVGYAQLEREGDGGTSGELAVDGAHAAGLLDAAEAAAAGPLTIWTHGAGSPLAEPLGARGYERVRLLHQLRRPGGLAVPEVAVPAGVAVRPFVVGRDEDAWLALNAAAFAQHAEQGGWTRADLAGRIGEPWFDPAGFFLAESAAGLLGFHWTKIHPVDGDGATAAGSAGPGEVYVLGIAPDAQGMGLGAALLAVGLRYLHGRGCPYVLLYVDDSNTAALRLYERFGFARHDLDAQWTSPA